MKTLAKVFLIGGLVGLWGVQAEAGPPRYRAMTRAQRLHYWQGRAIANQRTQAYWQRVRSQRPLVVPPEAITHGPGRMTVQHTDSGRPYISYRNGFVPIDRKAYVRMVTQRYINDVLAGRQPDSRKFVHDLKLIGRGGNAWGHITTGSKVRDAKTGHDTAVRRFNQIYTQPQQGQCNGSGSCSR